MNNPSATDVHDIFTDANTRWNQIWAARAHYQAIGFTPKFSMLMNVNLRAKLDTMAAAMQFVQMVYNDETLTLVNIVHICSNNTYALYLLVKIPIQYISHAVPVDGVAVSYLIRYHPDFTWNHYDSLKFYNKNETCAMPQKLIIKLESKKWGKPPRDFYGSYRNIKLNEKDSALFRRAMGRFYDKKYAPPSDLTTPNLVHHKARILRNEIIRNIQALEIQIPYLTRDWLDINLIYDRFYEFAYLLESSYWRTKEINYCGTDFFRYHVGTMPTIISRDEYQNCYGLAFLQIKYYMRNEPFTWDKFLRLMIAFWPISTLSGIHTLVKKYFAPLPQLDKNLLILQNRPKILEIEWIRQYLEEPAVRTVPILANLPYYSKSPELLTDFMRTTYVSIHRIIDDPYYASLPIHLRECIVWHRDFTSEIYEELCASNPDEIISLQVLAYSNNISPQYCKRPPSECVGALPKELNTIICRYDFGKPIYLAAHTVSNARRKFVHQVLGYAADEFMKPVYDPTSDFVRKILGLNH